MPEISDEVVAAAQLADYEWSRTREPDGRGWGSVPDDQVRRLITGAVAAERERILAIAESAAVDGATRRYFADLIREKL